ncbi:MAG: hypothetical protein ABR991_13880, partial [Terracidiphilus sp.]
MTDASGTSISSATISLTPASSSLAAGDSQQFVATVANASNSAVTWTLALAPIAPQAAGSIQAASSSAGTISPTGLYTAPANPPNQMNVQLTATSIVDSHVSASTNISVTPSLSMTVSPAVANVTAGAA